MKASVIVSYLYCVAGLSCSSLRGIPSAHAIMCAVDNTKPATSNFASSGAMEKSMRGTIDLDVVYRARGEEKLLGIVNDEERGNPSVLEEKSNLPIPPRADGSVFSRAKWHMATKKAQLTNKIGTLNNSIIEKADKIVCSVDEFLKYACRNEMFVWLCDLVEEVAEIQNSESDELLPNVNILN